MRALVTGSAGFIGAAVTHRLLSEGYDVVGVDSLDPYYDVALKRARTQRLQEHPRSSRYTFLEADLASFELDSLPSPDVIIHLAAQVGVRLPVEQEPRYVHSNLVAFHRVLAYATTVRDARFLYASSSSVYGASTQLPFREDDPAVSPLNFYAATKRANELMAFAAFSRHQRTSTGLRFFTVYGPQGRPDMAIYRFVRQLHNNEKIRLFGDGLLRRDYTYIDDAVEAIVRLARGSETTASVINIGSRTPYTTRDILQRLAELTGKTADIELTSSAHGEMECTHADTARLLQRTGFEPSTRIEDGLKSFCAWYPTHA